MGCGNCQHRTAPAPTPAPLFQIRQGYRAQWNNLALSVESDAQGWALHVQDAARTLYSAHRLGPQAAKTAAVEFAISVILGFASSVQAASVARELNWQAYL
jgi:hypothetical protein